MPVALSRPRVVSALMASSRVRFALHAVTPIRRNDSTDSGPVSASDDAIGNTMTRARSAPPASCTNFCITASDRGPPPTITRLPRAERALADGLATADPEDAAGTLAHEVTRVSRSAGRKEQQRM